ncbi:hypothetical protein [Rubrivirga sp. IMCC43871]|uniref:hypothetical protein n=1 Tax=Rubrivirga sp. IMCC43871 TaxID=3391575 RepID=UPI00398FB294
MSSIPLAGRPLVLAALVLVSLLAAGCSTFEEVYGRPDPFEWTYFEGPPEAVVDAIGATFSQTGVRVESYRDEAGGVIITTSSRRGSAQTADILVQATTEEGFGSRAQLYPTGAPLPRWLEIEITGRL